jgi:hypothetical protein
MTDNNDWRLQGQEKYLYGIQLIWKQYKRYSQTRDHDHCEFCWAKFMEENGPNILHEGFATVDNYRWVCKKCYEDFKVMFNWQ